MGPPRGGSRGGSPAAPPRCRIQSQQSPANMSQQFTSSTMVGSGEPGAMHPARRQRSAVQTGTRFVSLRENKQCPVSLKQLNQYSGEGARPRGPHPHTAKKGPCGPAKRVEREGPKRRGPDGIEQGLSPAGEKHLRPSECRFGTSAAACGREAAALAARDGVVSTVDACLHHGDARLRQEVERHRRKGRRPKLLGALASLARWQEQEMR